MLAGDSALLNDGVRFTTAIASRFQDVMSACLSLHPWVYPPTFLLLILPLGLLGPTASYVTFLSVGFACLMLAIHAWPASRAPVIAGVLLGLLVFKPQLAVLVPVALLAGRRWRALVAAGCSAGLLSLASLAAFGTAGWINWFRLMLGGTAQFSQWEAIGRQSGMSVFACVYAVSHVEGVSRLAQDVVGIVAALLVAYVFYKQARPPIAAAALLLATGLAAPHYSNYDMLVGCVGAILVWLEGMKHGFRSGELILCLLCWVAPLTFSPRLTLVAAAAPACTLLLLGHVVARAGPGWKPSFPVRVLQATMPGLP